MSCVGDYFLAGKKTQSSAGTAQEVILLRLNRLASRFPASRAQYSENRREIKGRGASKVRGHLAKVALGGGQGMGRSKEGGRGEVIHYRG